jgi:hypothetical protein
MVVFPLAAPSHIHRV